MEQLGKGSWNHAFLFVNQIYLFLFHILHIDRLPERQDVAPVFTYLRGKHFYGKKELPTKGSFLTS